MSMLKFFRVPFALSGTKTPIPDAADPSGLVSYIEGYGADYQRAKSDPLSKNIERDKMNQVFFDATNAIGELQSQGIPDFITSVLNGGAPFPYAGNAVVRYAGELYISRVVANTALPTDNTKWGKFGKQRLIDVVEDWFVPNDGVTSATAAIQNMITAYALSGAPPIIFFPNGTYLLTAPESETGEPRSYAAAVIWKQLKNVKVCGTKTTKFTQNSTGPGAPEFAMFRWEECEDFEFCHFAADGSGIDIHTTGAARSSVGFICNHNLDTKVDFPTANRNIHVHHAVWDNFGGGICSATRTEAGFAYPLVTRGISIHDIQASNISGQNHFAGITYSTNVHVYNCYVVNPLTLTAQIGNCFADMSAGVINAVVENNYAIGFTGGVKAESHTGAGVASNEDRPSQRVVFRNNTLEQIGDPIQLVFPGPSGGAWYGIKLNGIDHAAYSNTITARSTNVSTGGLYQGLLSVSTLMVPVETQHMFEDNTVSGTVLGSNHDNPTDPNRRFQAHFVNNKFRDLVVPGTAIEGNDGTGMVLSRGGIARGNRITRSKRAAISMQTVDMTFAYDNVAVDCADTDIATITATAVYTQIGSGAQGYWEFDGNVILDTRGGSAAKYGYFFEGGTTYANRYSLTVGETQGLATGICYDTYFNAQGKSWVVAGATTVPREFFATQSPQTGGAASLATWRRGDVAINLTPAVGSPDRWICTTGGSPGTWRPTANLT